MTGIEVPTPRAFVSKLWELKRSWWSTSQKSSERRHAEAQTESALRHLWGLKCDQPLTIQVPGTGDRFKGGRKQTAETWAQLKLCSFTLLSCTCSLICRFKSGLVGQKWWNWWSFEIDRFWACLCKTNNARRWLNAGRWWCWCVCWGGGRLQRGVGIRQSHHPAFGGCARVVRKDCASIGVAAQQKWVDVLEWLFQTCSAPRTAPHISLTACQWKQSDPTDETHPAALGRIWTQMMYVLISAAGLLHLWEPLKTLDWDRVNKNQPAC